MNKNRSIAKNLFIIGTINALTGYYGLHYKTEDNKSYNKVTFESKLEIESEISITSREESYLHNTNINSAFFDTPSNSNDYILMPYIKETSYIKVGVKKGFEQLENINIENSYIGNVFSGVLSPDASYEEKQKFLLESLDIKGLKSLFIPKNKRYNFSKDEQNELEYKVMDMMRWLDSKVREEKKEKTLAK